MVFIIFHIKYTCTWLKVPCAYPSVSGYSTKPVVWAIPGVVNVVPLSYT